MALFTPEERIEILKSVGAWPPPPPKPKPEPVVRLVANRERDIEDQRERTARELRWLSDAEQRAVAQGRMVAGSRAYYERQEQALADAKRIALEGRGSVTHAYDPISRFEQGNK